MRLLALSRYGRLGASSRLRTYQFIPHLQAAGIEVDVHALLDDNYVAGLYSNRRTPGSVLSGYAGRLRAMLRIRHYDAVLIEKEALPWLPVGLELALLGSSAKIVIDYDDAVFHRYDQNDSVVVRRVLGHKLDRLMRRADVVCVGNDYLRQRAAAAGARQIEWIPTVVDLDRYTMPTRPRQDDRPVVVGWIGSPSTAAYLSMVVPALQTLSRSRAIRCVAVGARPDQVAGTPFESLPWTEASEVGLLQQIDIGIMPLPNAPWERGKCGYKLIQYMACGLPVVASAVGANRSIVSHGNSGFLAESVADWESALSALVDDRALRLRMGGVGRSRVEETYSLQVQGLRLVSILTSLAEA